MTGVILSAPDLHVAENQRASALPDGSIRSERGNFGLVFATPPMAVRDGVHEVVVSAQALDPEAPSTVEVFGADRIYAAHRYTNGRRLQVRIFGQNHLQIRFHAAGEAFAVSSVEVRPILLDEEPADAARLRTLIAELLAAHAEPSTIYHLIDRLAELGEASEAERLRTAFVEGQGRMAARIRAMLMALNTPGATGEILDDERPLGRDRIQEVLSERPVDTFDLLNLSVGDRDTLLARGYQPDFLEATRLARFPEEPPRHWRKETAENASGQAQSGTPLFHYPEKLDLSFQAEVAAHGAMSAHCPVTGRRLRSSHAFVQHFCHLAYTFYRFEGVEVFYVLCGGHANSRMALYMPRTETLVHVQEPKLRWHPPAVLTRALWINMVDHREEVRRYLRAPTRPALVVGNDNLGHYIWTDLAGIDYAACNGLLSRIEEVVECERVYLRPQTVFPELHKLPATQLPNDSDSAFLHCLRRNLMPIRLTDAAIGDSLVERIRAAAEREATPAGRPPADAPRPLLWVNLRAHNKQWTDQAEGYANILNAVAAEFGAAGAVLDGWTDCVEIAQAIRARVGPDVVLYDGLGLELLDSIHWAFAVDAYLCTIGAGLVLVSWLADKPGVAHSERAHLEQMRWWSRVRPGATTPTVPHAEQVHDLGGALYCNYELDWRVLLDLLLPMLRDGARRGSHSHAPL